MSNENHEIAVDSIYTALLQLMEQKPYEEITITDIVRRAGVSRMAYYRNYDSKDEILTRRLRGLLDPLTAMLRDDETLTQMRFWTTFFETIRGNSIVQYIMKAGLHASLYQINMEFMEKEYVRRFPLSENEEERMMLIYRMVGCTAGLIMYIQINPAVYSEVLAAQILS